ncbi:C-type lectin domain family 14 member A [Echeneis naucrates]|uniref:C-type lectin domain family 14 member A n=1 Tax=Echeneis naucrates TaxID=173247 RepID=UPI0011142EAF|nr:complement component C1q receptor-like [Echeneis naucrates]
MAPWFSSCWIYLWIFILSGKVFADVVPPQNYTIQHTMLPFDKAMEDCSPGVLTTLATEQQAAEILRLISMSVPPQRQLTFWVGLRKAKSECVVLDLPLRGFRWTEDGSQESQVDRWLGDPQKTCTTTRCAALQVEFNQSVVTKWGLLAVPCKNSYKFICKLKDQQAGWTKDKNTTEPAAPGLGSGTTLGSRSCVHPVTPEVRFLTLDAVNSSRIQVTCWSGIQLQLHCWGNPAVWRFLDDSPANLTAICQLCAGGFQKDAFGNCVDVDECSPGNSCRFTCLNTLGSYRCVCSDENGKHYDEGSAACADTETDNNSLLSGILVPVLVVVAVLVLLVVVVVVAVKCCLKKRSKTRSEKMLMKNKDG